MLKAARPFLEGKSADEQARISNAIQGLGIDWAPAVAKNDTKPAVHAELKIKGAGSDGKISAGSEVTLEATITNNGLTPLSRVHGHIETEHTTFRGKEYLFGALAPGATKTWSVNVKIAKDMVSRSDILVLKLFSNTQPIDAEARLAVVTSYVPHPQFAYSYSFDDAERGDGDGILERGEGVDLLVHVTNVGQGDAAKTTLRLKSAAGEDLFLERGRTDIAAIPAGETRIGRLKFKVRSNQTADRQNLPLELSMWDNDSQEWLEDEFAVVAEPAAPAKITKKKGAGIISRETPLLVAAKGDATVIASLPKGTAVTFGARADDFVRVDLPEDGFAWVAAQDIRMMRTSKKTLAGLKFHPMRRPPQIDLEGQLGGRVVETDSVMLSGTISGRELRDMYVLLNDKKVYYASGPKADAPAADAVVPAGFVAPNDHAVALPFKQMLPLKDGLNKVVIVARLDERVVTYRSLYVSRVAKPLSPAVAEAASELKDKPGPLPAAN
jgi:carboxyl-terminal processing protease